MEGKLNYIGQSPELGRKARIAESRNILTEFKENFDFVLGSYLKLKEKEARKISHDSVDLVREISRLSKNSGKRIRPLFVYAGYLSGGGMAHDAVLFAA